MNGTHTIKAYILFFISINLLGLGISLTTLAELGTTAIMGPAYVISLFSPLSFGMLTMLVNILFVLAQVILLRGEFPKFQYLQLLVGPVLGASVDLWTYVFSFLIGVNYPIQLMVVLLGCLVIAISIVLQLRANVVTNPAEGIVKVISLKLNRNFGTVKVLFDLGLVLIAVVLSLLLSGTIYGVREGTLISAVLVGILVKRIQQLSTYRRRPLPSQVSSLRE